MAKKKPLVPQPNASSWENPAVDDLYADLRVGERIADAQAAVGKPEEPTLGETIAAAWESETTVSAFLRHIGSPQFNPDEAYNPGDTEEWKRLTEGIPAEYHNTLLTSVSRGHADHKRAQIQEEMKRREQLSSGTGIAAQIGVSLIDPGAWALSSVAAPAAILSKGSRVARFFKGGAAAGVTNGAVEEYLRRTQETRDPSDVAFATLVGFGMGGGISALLKPKEVSKLNGTVGKVIEQTELDNIKANSAAGVSLTESGEETLNGGTKARVLTVEDMRKRINEQADAATSEVLADIKAKGEGVADAAPVVPRRALSAEEKAKLQARVDREDELWNQRKADEEAALLEAQKPDLSEGADTQGGKLDSPMQAAMKRAGLASKVATNESRVAKKSAWDKYEEDQFAAKLQTEELAYAERQVQIADTTEDLTLTPKDGPEATPVVDTGVAQTFAAKTTAPKEAIIDPWMITIGGGAPEYKEVASSIFAQATPSNSSKFKDYLLVHVDDGNGTGNKVLAFDKDGNVVGDLGYIREDGKFNPAVFVVEAHQRKGIATAMYDAARARGWIPHTDGSKAMRTNAGMAFREAYDAHMAAGGKADEVVEQGDEVITELDEFTPPLHNVGDDIVVEAPDGSIIGGRIKSYNEDTGMMVIMDDASGKARRVNINEVQWESADNADLFDDSFDVPEGFIDDGSIGSGKIMPVEKASPYQAADEKPSAFTHLRIPFTNFRIPIRFDYYAKLINSTNNPIRRLTQVLLSDAVGDVDHAGRGLNASELSSIGWHTFKARFFGAYNDAFDSFAKEKGWGMVARAKNEKEFSEMVTRAVRDYSTSQFTNPHVSKAVMEIQKIHRELLAEAQKYGVKGAEDIFPDPFYMMRKFNHGKIQQLAKRFGNDQLIALVKGAVRSVRPVTEEMAAKIARNYVIVVRSIPYEDMVKLRMGDAGRARLRAIAHDKGIEDDAMDDILDMVLQKPGKVEGDSGRLKSRTLFNESYKMKVKDSEGVETELSMDDFFENDSRVLMDLYTRQMSGHIGLARMGIRSDADFERILSEARLYGIENFGDDVRLEKEIGHMKEVYNHILGRPMSTEVYGTQERIMKGIRDFNFIRMMGQVGFAQLAEIGNTLGHAGWRAFTSHMPSLREVVKMAKGGHMDDQLSRDLINMAGLGGEMSSMHPLARSADDAMFNADLTKIETGLAYGRHAVAQVSGLAPITNMLRQISSRAFVQKFSDFARGSDKLSEKAMNKLAWAGITKENIKGVFSDLKKYSKVTGKTDKVESIDWEKWQTQSPDTYDTFRMAVWRESRRVVQENTIGETAPWMHSQIGKLLTQFRGFMLVAHAKQSLYSLHHRDMGTANAILASTLFGGLGYVAQTSLNYAGNKEELDKRLSMDRIAASAFQRSSFSAMIPAGADTLSAFAGWDTLFKYGRTTGLASGAILGNPTVDFISNKVGGTSSNITQMVTTDDFMWTQRDVKNAVNTIAPNLLGVRTLLESWASQYPENNPLRSYNDQ